MTDRSRVRMPFGKFRDTPIDELTDGYLSWLHDCPPFPLKFWLAEAVDAEYQARGLTPQAPPEDTIIRFPHRESQLVAELFDIGFKTLMKREHPDIGGCVIKAQKLNALRDLFAPQLKQQREGGSR